MTIWMCEYMSQSILDSDLSRNGDKEIETKFSD